MFVESDIRLWVNLVKVFFLSIILRSFWRFRAKAGARRYYVGRFFVIGQVSSYVLRTIFFFKYINRLHVWSLVYQKMIAQPTQLSTYHIF